MLVGISGKIGTGKTTLGRVMCQELSEEMGVPTHLLNFGDALKEGAAYKFNFSLEDCYTESGKRRVIDTPNVKEYFGGPVSVRTILQVYGGDCRKNDLYVWVREIEKRIQHHPFKKSVFIIGDVRHKTEAEMIQNNRGYLFRVNPYPGWNQWSNDISETELDNFDGFDAIISPQYGKDLKNWAMALTGYLMLAFEPQTKG